MLDLTPPQGLHCSGHTATQAIYDVQVFISLCQRPVADYLERFGFKSELLKVMYAVTDGFAGLTGSWETPGSGMNFLVHSMVGA